MRSGGGGAQLIKRRNSIKGLYLKLSTLEISFYIDIL